MEFRTLGRTGIKVSCLCFGTDNFADPTPEEECVEMLNRALDAGINLLDTGDVYARGEGERIIGRALKANKRRHQVLLATKADFGKSCPGRSLDEYVPSSGINEHGNSRLNIVKACEGSLKRLQTDCIDLYQIHRHWPSIAIDETLSALDDLVHQGKIRYIGCSTHPAWAVMEALMTSELKGYARYVSEQSPYNLLDRRIENELIPMCRRHGIGVIAWAPLAMGILAGRYQDAKNFPKDSRAAYRGGFYAERVTEKGIRVALEFAKIAGKIGISPAQLAVLWCKDQEGVTAPLIGPRTLKHLKHLLPVLDMKLDDEIREACDQIVPPGSAVSNFFNTSGWMKTKIL
jgi:aryl-alcohol dehydrogenase-like predicted oxidoreductase